MAKKPAAPSFYCTADRHKHLTVTASNGPRGKVVRFTSYTRNGGALCTVDVSRTSAIRQANALLNFTKDGLRISDVRGKRAGDIWMESVAHSEEGKTTTNVELTQARDGISFQHALVLGPAQRARLIETIREIAR